MAGRGSAFQGIARQGFTGEGQPSPVRLYLRGQARTGEAGLGIARHRKVFTVMRQHYQENFKMRGLSGYGLAWRGVAWHGMVGQGSARFSR